MTSKGYCCVDEELLFEMAAALANISICPTKDTTKLDKTPYAAAVWIQSSCLRWQQPWLKGVNAQLQMKL